MDGQFHRVRMTVVLTTMKVYLDGNLILSGTTTANGFNPEVQFGASNSAPYIYDIAYLYWVNSVIPPTIIDPTSSPVVQSSFYSWLAASTGLYPTNNVCSAFFLNRYWFAGLELTPSGTLTNNVMYILDTNGRWFFRRGSNTPANAAVMVVYEEQLWWGDANSTDLYMLSDSSSELTSTTLDFNDIATYFMKKDDLGAAGRDKLFRTLFIKYKSSSPFTIVAFVDDMSLTTFTIPASTNVNTVVVNFKPDGTQIGKHLQLGIFNTTVQVLPNSPTSKSIVTPIGTVLTDLEIYEIKVLAKAFEPRMMNQMGVTT
jgi:hypothetical protein